MKIKSISTIALIIGLILFTGCRQGTEPSRAPSASTPSAVQEEAAILATLNAETAAAFSRDYDSWQAKWVHSPFVTKTYIDFPENTFTETRGWEEVDGFVKEFFLEHPDPEPAPKPLDEIAVRLYGNGAWVSYEAMDSVRGLKRETRLMEKIDGQWKIAGMHTTIYGFDNK